MHLSPPIFEEMLLEMCESTNREKTDFRGEIDVFVKKRVPYIMLYIKGKGHQKFWA